jgi:hypothetical protein
MVEFDPMQTHHPDEPDPAGLAMPGLTTRPARLTYLFGADGQSGKLRDASQTVLNKGSTDVYKLYAGAQDSVGRFHIPGNSRRLNLRGFNPAIDLVINLITDPDQNPGVLRFATKILATFAGRVLNRPEAVLKTSRDQVANMLGNIDGLIVPKVVRFRGRANQAATAIARSGLQFPAILRHVGTHSGRIIMIANNLEQLSAVLKPDIIYFLTEFHDARSEDQLYHKYRVFFFGSRAVIRHRLVSDHWNVHAADRMRFLQHHPPLIALEHALIDGGMATFPDLARRVLTQVRAHMPLDFFGVDFTILPDNRVLLFEANATMEFFPVSDDPHFPYGSKVLQDAQNAYNDMINTQHGIAHV